MSSKFCVPRPAPLPTHHLHQCQWCLKDSRATLFACSRAEADDAKRSLSLHLAAIVTHTLTKSKHHNSNHSFLFERRNRNKKSDKNGIQVTISSSFAGLSAERSVDPCSKLRSWARLTCLAILGRNPSFESKAKSAAMTQNSAPQPKCWNEFDCSVVPSGRIRTQLAWQEVRPRKMRVLRK